jgi:hypothetical protein
MQKVLEGDPAWREAGNLKYKKSATEYAAADFVRTGTVGSLSRGELKCF